MSNNRITFRNGVSIGNQSPTALNILIGANSPDQLSCEKKKLSKLLNSDYPITIITDLSLVTAPNEEALWSEVVRDGRYIAGSVPIYQVIDDRFMIDKNKLIDLIWNLAENGIQLLTIHPTPTVELLNKSKSRITPVTSRGGAAVLADMLYHHRSENVYLQVLDEIIRIAHRHSIVLSIGSSFRSANIHDALDEAYYLELEKQLEIAEYCSKNNVEVIIETPGHVSPQGIFSLCDYLEKNCPYPIMPLGPLPTDCAFEQDDLAGAIGAVLMGTKGFADILSIVTQDEHMGGIPSFDSIESAIKKYSVAKHIIDIYKIKDSSSDYEVSKKRSEKKSCLLSDKECSRCSLLCPLKLIV